jgi:hypothetical protein
VEEGLRAGWLAADRRNRARWPDRATVQAFIAEADRRVEESLTNAALDVPGHPLLARGEAVGTIREHEAMHHETLLYLFHRLPHELDLRMESEAQLRVTVRDDRGQTIDPTFQPDVDLMVNDRPTSFRRRAMRTDEEGRARFDRLSAGHVQVFATARDYVDVGAVDLALTAGSDSSIELRLARTGTLRAAVVGPESRPAAGITLNLDPVRPHEGNAFGNPTRASRAYEFGQRNRKIAPIVRA